MSAQGDNADRLTPIELDEPLMLGDDEPTECLDESGCEVGPDVINAIDRSPERWQAVNVGGVMYLAVGCTAVVAFRENCDRRNIDALVRRLNLPTVFKPQVTDVGPDGLGPMLTGFDED